MRLPIRHTLYHHVNINFPVNTDTTLGRFWQNILTLIECTRGKRKINRTKLSSGLDKKLLIARIGTKFLLQGIRLIYRLA